jgi:F-type H+-transporting ATPase subunit gamma
MGANTREIRTRIKSVKNTQQITKAMQMVAAAKVRRAQERVTAAKPFSQKIAEVFRQVAGQLPKGEFKSPLLDQRPVKSVALVVITSDKGLSGGYNANVIRSAVLRHRHWVSQGIQPKLIIVGTKGVQFFRHSNFDVVARFQNLPAVPTFSEASEIVKEASALFADGTVDQVEFIYTVFKNMVTQTPTTITLLPATMPEADDTAPKGPQSLYEFEPSADEVMTAIIPKYLETVVYQALLESATSQLAAQMTAMSAASKNAKELAAALSLVYNKARQAAITQEISEVVGGAAAAV